ncbi:hypothetical protein M3Y95_01174300 [Aphelenchoides besseyi]|nr:hypothetical protein M3Y95_01174300 [Aphelenchoides besseyi]
MYLGNKITMVVLGPLANWSQSLSILSISLFTFAFMQELTFTWIDYYYRYVLLCRNERFTNCRLTICIMISVFITAVHTVLSSYLATQYFFPSSPQAIEYWPAIRQQFQLQEKPLPFGIIDPETPYMSLCMASACLMTTAVYSTIAYCTYKIRQTLKENARRQSRRKESRRVTFQITMVMICQATLPFIVLALPILLVTILNLFNVGMQHVGDMITLTMSWTPVLKPFATIFIVTPYRRFIARKLVGKWVSLPTTTASADNSFSHSQPTTNPIISSTPLLQHSDNKTEEQIFL